MLREIKVRNLAILPELHIRFEESFNVLTGETGAGKSILVDAVGLLAGTRASNDVVRAGEDLALVEGVVEMPRSSPIWEALSGLGFERTGNEILLRRTLSADGRSRAYVNDSPATAGALSSLAGHWIDLSAQHGSQELLSEDSHLGLLDAYGNLREEFETYRGHFSRTSDLFRRLSNLRKRKEEALRQKEFLSYQLRELRDAELVTGEMEELEARHRRLKHGHQLMTAAVETESLLSGEGGAGEALGGVLARLKSGTRLDSTLDPLVARAEEAAGLLRGLSAEVSEYRSRLDLDPGDLDRINERLSRLQGIVRKYGSIEKAVGERDRAAALLSLAEDTGLEEKELEEELTREAGGLAAAAGVLTKKRKSASGGFAREVTAELKLFGMPQARIEPEFLPPAEEDGLKFGTGRFGPAGAEAVRFLFAPNPGEGFKPLAKIASGGELSRALLAVKSVALSKGSSDGMTYLFDEVDAGIGGETAERVGIRLRALSRGRQVLCVTHLAQIASYAVVHLKVEKEVKAGRTLAAVLRLTEEARREELARMIGGIRVTEKTREHAAELLERGHKPCRESVF